MASYLDRGALGGGVQHVLRLHVSVRDAMSVQVRQRQRELMHEPRTHRRFDALPVAQRTQVTRDGAASGVPGGKSRRRARMVGRGKGSRRRGGKREGEQEAWCGGARGRGVLEDCMRMSRRFVHLQKVGDVCVARRPQRREHIELQG